MAKLYTIEDIEDIITNGLYFELEPVYYNDGGGYSHCNGIVDYMKAIEEGSKYGKEESKGIYQILGEGIAPHNNSSTELDYYSSIDKARKALIILMKEKNEWIDKENINDIYGEPLFDRFEKVNGTEYSSGVFRYYIKEINVLD